MQLDTINDNLLYSDSKTKNSMYQHLLDYFNKYPEKKLFFINNLVIDLNLSEPILSKQLTNLTTKYPSIGFYNRNTGWFIKSSDYFPLKTKNKYFLLNKTHGTLLILFIFIKPVKN